MKFYILTLFPQIFDSVFAASIVGRAIDKKLVAINIINLRDFASDRHKTVDDKPYGGGRGMILKVDVIDRAIQSLKSKPYSILLSAGGAKYNQKKAIDLSRKKSLLFVCGHYEGVDARVEKLVDETLSIGDFVLTGGEIAACAIVDSVIRLLPGAIHPESLSNESFSQETFFLEFPQYTRPVEYKGLKVPKVLLSGNHRQIEKWRLVQAERRTKKFRPDLSIVQKA